MQFSLLELTMNDACEGISPPHLINVDTLPCESRKGKDVILKWDITKENCIKRIVYASSKWTCRL